MKYGWRIVVHNDIKWSVELHECLKTFVKRFSSEGSYKSGGPYRTWFRRNCFGFGLTKEFKLAFWNSKPPFSPYAFKRLSTKRRIFGVVPTDRLDISETETCGEILPKAKLKIPYDEKDYYTFAEVGEIKG